MISIPITYLGSSVKRLYAHLASTVKLFRRVLIFTMPEYLRSMYLDSLRHTFSSNSFTQRGTLALFI